MNRAGGGKAPFALRIVGLGPGDPDLLTLGSREWLRAVGRAVTVMAPPALALFLESDGIGLELGDRRLRVRRRRPPAGAGRAGQSAFRFRRFADFAACARAARHRRRAR